MIATYRSRCDSCEEAIEEGEEITFEIGGRAAVHQDCPGPQLPSPHPMCTSCWLPHPEAITCDTW